LGPRPLFLDSELLYQTLEQEHPLPGLAVAVLVVAVTGMTPADEDRVGAVAENLRSFGDTLLLIRQGQAPYFGKLRASW